MNTTIRQILTRQSYITNTAPTTTTLVTNNQVNDVFYDLEDGVNRYGLMFYLTLSLLLLGCVISVSLAMGAMGRKVSKKIRCSLFISNIALILDCAMVIMIFIYYTSDEYIQIQDGKMDNYSDNVFYLICFNIAVYLFVFLLNCISSIVVICRFRKIENSKKRILPL